MKHIAVVVVHGVGDPGADTSSKKIASMLLDIPGSNGATRYQPFYESPVRIGVRRVETTLPMAGFVAPQTDAPKSAIFDDRGSFVAEQQSQKPTSNLPSDIGYTFDQIGTYEPAADDAYETVRLSSVKRGTEGTPDKCVHVFELYWADLVTVGKGLRLFGDIYQIMLHLASVGQHAVDMALAKNPTDRRWKLLDRVHVLAVRFLCLPLPILNLLLLASSMMTLAAALPVTAQPYIALGILNALGIAACGVPLFFLRCGKTPWGRALLWLLLMVMLSIVIWGVAWKIGFSGSGYQKFLAAEVFTLSIAALLPVFSAYGKVRPGASSIAMFAIFTSIVIAAFEIFSCQEMVVAGLHVSEALWLLLLVLGWIPLLLFSLASWAAGLYVVYTTPDPQRTCARRAVWTARLSLSVPTVLFFIVTLTLWAGILFAGTRTLAKTSQDLAYAPGLVRTWLEMRLQNLGLKPEHWLELREPNVHEFADQLWKACAGSVLTPIATIAVVAVLIAIWSLLPSILSEIRVPKTDRRTLAYGRWLDGGFCMLRCAGEIMFLASLLIVPLGIPSGAWNDMSLNPVGTLYDALQIHANATFIIVGSLVAGSVGLRLLPGRLGNAVKGAAVPVRAALDVDAYLRVFPQASNPKGKIFARYASLLRYLAKWRDPADPAAGYEKIVVVAHSQGTVITADLFRFLRHFKDTSLDRFGFTTEEKPKVPIHLFTMGCPLRQLYGRRLPELYNWTEHTCPANPSGNVQSLPVNHCQLPNPKELKVAEWVNAYRSGDYIGRNLWRPDDCDATWTSQFPYTNSPQNDQEEFCIGPGAHIHYWDESAPAVAEKIDNLIT